MKTEQRALDLASDLNKSRLGNESLIKIEPRDNGKRGIGGNQNTQLSEEFVRKKCKKVGL
jgi:hypothetical protein